MVLTGAAAGTSPSGPGGLRFPGAGRPDLLSLGPCWERGTGLCVRCRLGEGLPPELGVPPVHGWKGDLITLRYIMVKCY